MRSASRYLGPEGAPASHLHRRPPPPVEAALTRPVAQLLALQRSAGNQAVASLLGRTRPAPVQRSACCGGCASGGTCESEEPVDKPGGAAPAADVQRTIIADNPKKDLPGQPPRQAWEDVRDALGKICPGTTVNQGGTVTPGGCPTDGTPPSRTGCKCVCDLASSKNPDPWKIRIIDEPASRTIPGQREVWVDHSRTIFARGRWGGGADAGKRVFVDQARTMAHELCGHAWLFERGVHPKGPEAGGGRPSHDPTVVIENEIGVEMDGPGTVRRGLFADPHHGESLYLVTVSNYPKNKTSVATLPDEMQARLATVAKVMQSENGKQLMADIMGHADRTGSAAINQVISRQRADLIRQYLVMKGVKPSRILVSVGKSFQECPETSTDDGACRKVDIYVFNFRAASESPVPANAKTPNPTPQPELVDVE